MVLEESSGIQFKNINVQLPIIYPTHSCETDDSWHELEGSVES